MLGLYSMLECNVCCDCWTWQIWIVFYVEDCGESYAECCVHLVGVDRECILDGFVVCIVGKMTQDVGMVESIVVSSPSSLVGF